MPTKLLKDLEWDLLINNVDYKLLISKMINEVSLDQFKRMSRRNAMSYSLWLDKNR